MLTGREKLVTAYHESGHVLLAWLASIADRVHKVSIIPRGLAALGYTMQRPEGDRYLMTHSELESRVQVLLALKAQGFEIDEDDLQDERKHQRR